MERITSAGRYFGGWCELAARRREVKDEARFGVRVMGKLGPIKATRKKRFRLDEYDPSDDPERQRRIEAHRRRVQRAMRRLRLRSEAG